MQETEVDIRVYASLAEIPQEDWDACACPEASNGGRPFDPFTTYRFVRALEVSGSVGDGTGWRPQYLGARVGNELIAVAPMYLKSHSQGEYIFDHNWAHAYESAGGRYYPKLQIAVPHTPVTGRRFLTKPDFTDLGRHALAQGAAQLAANNGISSVHVTFCTPEEARAADDLGLMHRTTQQFHWHNNGYPDFAGFLAALSSRKRKNIRKERAEANGAGLVIEELTGDAIEPHHWDHFWQFYQDTGARKWGSPYLTRAFFDEAQEHLRNDILLVMARDDSGYIAGAMNLIGRDALFGRYWGCIRHYPCLHFELCYYRAIEFAIDHGLMRVEAGAQGQHKLARGYLPAETHSLHWIGDQGFAGAVDRYLEAERAAVEEEIEILTDYGPFRKFEMEEQE